MTNFLETDIAGTPAYSMNPNILSQLHQFLLEFSDSELDKQQLSSMWDQHLENSTTKKVIQKKTIKNCNFRNLDSVFNFYRDDVSTFWKALGVDPQIITTVQTSNDINI